MHFAAALGHSIMSSTTHDQVDQLVPNEVVKGKGKMPPPPPPARGTRAATATVTGATATVQAQPSTLPATEYGPLGCTCNTYKRLMISNIHIWEEELALFKDRVDILERRISVSKNLLIGIPEPPPAKKRKH